MKRAAPTQVTKTGAWAAALALCFALSAPAAVIIDEAFDSDPGWYSRDGQMTVAWDNGTGVPAGSLRGTFASQDTPSFQIDAFRVDFSVLGGPWVGDYGNLYPGYTQFTFNFLADDVLPSSFVMQISDGSSTFIRNLLPQISSVSNFVSVMVPLAYDANWLGGSAVQFSNVMGSVSFLDLQLVRNTTVQQDYFLDNFTLDNDSLNGPGPSSAVPEASALHLWTVAAFMFLSIRRQTRRNRA